MPRTIKLRPIVPTGAYKVRMFDSRSTDLVFEVARLLEDYAFDRPINPSRLKQVAYDIRRHVSSEPIRPSKKTPKPKTSAPRPRTTTKKGTRSRT